MRDHFSYLVDDDAGAFFQKAANRAATPASRAPVPMAKTASEAPAFEKIAARLDRDIEIIKVAGACGINGGMMRRADAYIDRLLNVESDVSPEEFGEIFDKVAASAIMGDLESAFAELTAGVDPELHHVVERTLAKIGSDMTSLAMLEKEAILGAIARGAGRLFARGAVKEEIAAGRAIAKGMAGRSAVRAGEAAKGIGAQAAGKARSLATRVGEGAKGLGREFRVGRQGAMMEARAKTTANLAKARGIAAAGGPNALRAGDAARSLERGVGVRPGAPASREFMAGASKDLEKGMAKTKASLTPKPAGGAAAPANTTAARTAPPSAPAASQAKAIKAEGEAAKAQSDAADAARIKDGPDKPKGKGKPELSVLPGGKADNDNLKGTGTDGPAPKPKVDEPSAPKPKAEGGGTTPPPPGGAEDKPAGFMDAWKKATGGAGWKGLSAAEKGALIRGGVTGAVVYRAMTGHGVVTGGQGLV
jgi:hypothetical protein